MNKRKLKTICLAMCCSMVIAAMGCEIQKQPENAELKETETKTVTESEKATESIQATEATQETEAAQETYASQEKESSQATEASQETGSAQGIDDVQETVAETKEISPSDETIGYNQNDFEEPFGEAMSVDAATEKKMNIFLSNFSEAGLFAYDKEHPDINSICYWVHIWMKINKGSTIEYESRPDQTYEKISLEQLNQVTEKYLGITIKDEEAALVKAEWYFFENGNFYSPAADGESYTGLSIASKVEKLSDGRLKLYYNNYYQDIDAYLEGKDKNYSMTEEEASKNSDYEKSNSGYAIVRTEGSSYILEYLEVRN